MSDTDDPVPTPAGDQPLGDAPPPDPSGDPTRRRRTALIVGAVLAVVAAIALVWVLSGDGEDEDTATTDTTTSTVATTTSTTEGSTTTTAPETTTTAPDAVVPLSPDEAAFVVWPAPDGELRYDDPVAAATGFATELARFTDPVVGEFQQGDSRSGEVEVRAQATGAPTTVLVRQYGEDDSWWVIAATTPDIVLDDPQPQGAIDDPLLLSGKARAFEGTVQVSVLGDGSTEPLGTGFVTGRGDGVLGAFEGEIPWANPGGGWGVVLLYTLSEEDGTVWQASATRVGFIGGD